MDSTSNKLNIIPIYFRNILYDTDSNKLKFLVIFVLILAGIAFLHGIITEGVISPTSIVVMVISSSVAYIYFKRSYSNKLKILKKKIKGLSKPSILDDLCDDDSNKRFSNKTLCDRYYSSKKNFYRISDVLLQQFKFD